jgi:hypothetical protein
LKRTRPAASLSNLFLRDYIRVRQSESP